MLGFQVERRWRALRHRSALGVSTRTMRVSFIFVLFAAFVVSCSRAPSGVDVFTKSAELVEQYLNTNALGAEAAMLQLERYTRDSEKAGYRGGVGSLKLDQAYAAVYSRLYLVEKVLGKQKAADEYYQKAAEHLWQSYAADGQPRPTPELIRERIESVDHYFVEPQWKNQK